MFAEPAGLSDVPLAVPLLVTLVLISALSMVRYASCVQRMGARGASMLFALIPAVATLAAWAVQGSPIDATVVVALVCGGLACLAQVRSGRATAAADRHARLSGARA